MTITPDPAIFNNPFSNQFREALMFMSVQSARFAELEAAIADRLGMPIPQVQQKTRLARIDGADPEFPGFWTATEMIWKGDRTLQFPERYYEGELVPHDSGLVWGAEEGATSLFELNGASPSVGDIVIVHHVGSIHARQLWCFLSPSGGGSTLPAVITDSVSYSPNAWDYDWSEAELQGNLWVQKPDGRSSLDPDEPKARNFTEQRNTNENIHHGKIYVRDLSVHNEYGPLPVGAPVLLHFFSYVEDDVTVPAAWFTDSLWLDPKCPPPDQDLTLPGRGAA